MISMLEKRIRDLEMKLLEAFAQVDVERLRISKVQSLFSAIASLETSIKSLANNIEIEASKNKSMHGELTLRVEAQDRRGADQIQSIRDARSVMETLSEKIHSHFSNISDLKNHVSSLILQMVQIQNKTASSEHSIVECKSDIKSLKDALATANSRAIVEESSLNNHILILERKISGMEEQFKNFCNCAQDESKVTRSELSKIHQGIGQWEEKLSNKTNVSECNEKFLNLKEHISQSLACAKPIENTPEIDKINLKIKSIEFNIAQIFGLLKKIEIS